MLNDGVQLMIEMSIDEFRRKFPHLAQEILDENSPGLAIEIEREDVYPDPWRGYLPTPVDYIRRCKTLEEAYEVIDYLEKHGELTREEAESFRKILKEHGLSYFGPRKEDDYYYKKAKEYWLKLAVKKTVHMNSSNSG